MERCAAFSRNFAWEWGAKCFCHVYPLHSMDESIDLAHFELLIIEIAFIR
jgi:hypothetical protein